MEIINTWTLLLRFSFIFRLSSSRQDYWIFSEIFFSLFSKTSAQSPILRQAWTYYLNGCLCSFCFSFCSEANQNVERDDPEPARPASGRGGRLHRLHPRHSVHRQVRSFSLVDFQSEKSSQPPIGGFILYSEQLALSQWLIFSPRKAVALPLADSFCIANSWRSLIGWYFGHAESFFGRFFIT